MASMMSGFTKSLISFTPAPTTPPVKPPAKPSSKLPFFISNSLWIKKKIIEIDEFDTSIRHIFNYGHTFGHAIEAITNYSIPHGQAISIGMDLANYISQENKIMIHF